jgi:hypothetical protein
MLSDPRAISDIVVGGAPDLIGEEIVVVEVVRMNDHEVLVPREMPGVPEYAAVHRAEVTADQLWDQIVRNLDTRGPIPSADHRLALNFRQTAGTAVASAAVGLEAFANFHIWRAIQNEAGGKSADAADLRDQALNERYSDHLPVLLDRPRPTTEHWWPVFRRIQGLAALQRHGIVEPRKRTGLEGERSLAQRMYGGEYRGAAAMMFAAFEHFSPGWISPERRAALLQLDP